MIKIIIEGQMSVNTDDYDDLVIAEYIGDFKIKCTFKNGKQ
jgi:hypothetical protein